MKYPIYQVDSFTSRAFYGNPAGVCVLPSSIDETIMQKIASEMNLSETAFLWPEGDNFRLRWFTPTVEFELCGHATLAAVHILFETGMVNPNRQITFNTLSGPLFACNGPHGIELDFPSFTTHPIASESLRLPEIFGVTPTFVGMAGKNLLVEVESEDIVKRLSPDFRLMAQLDVHGVIVCALSAFAEFDFVSRYFSPAEPIVEDPVTGSAHCALAPYFAPRLNKSEMVGYQASRRGGVVRTRLKGNRVILSGDVITVLEGTINDNGM